MMRNPRWETHLVPRALREAAEQTGKGKLAVVGSLSGEKACLGIRGT